MRRRPSPPNVTKCALPLLKSASATTSGARVGRGIDELQLGSEELGVSHQPLVGRQEHHLAASLLGLVLVVVVVVARRVGALALRQLLRHEVVVADPVAVLVAQRLVLGPTRELRMSMFCGSAARRLGGCGGVGGEGLLAAAKAAATEG